MTEPYKSESENEMPRWIGMLRGLVFGLLFVSIIAMGLVGFAAFRLVMEAASSSAPVLDNLYHSDMLPAGAKLISISRVNAGTLLVYELGEKIHGRYYDAEGVLQEEQIYQ